VQETAGWNLSRPGVLPLHEPFASVDALTRAELQDVLLRIHGVLTHRRVTIVDVTHDIDQAVRSTQQPSPKGS
jgi:NitT/TauT family transport system ATP-binding protein